ncbi:hypothetical protein T439DRAFT_89881 [Meredithblackwellia eburnea MCA 4105]
MRQLLHNCLSIIHEEFVKSNEPVSLESQRFPERVTMRLLVCDTERRTLDLDIKLGDKRCAVIIHFAVGSGHTTGASRVILSEKYGPTSIELPSLELLNPRSDDLGMQEMKAYLVGAIPHLLFPAHINHVYRLEIVQAIDHSYIIHCRPIQRDPRNLSEFNVALTGIVSDILMHYHEGNGISIPDTQMSLFQEDQLLLKDCINHIFGVHGCRLVAYDSRAHVQDVSLQLILTIKEMHSWYFKSEAYEKSDIVITLHVHTRAADNDLQLALTPSARSVLANKP